MTDKHDLEKLFNHQVNMLPVAGLGGMTIQRWGHENMLRGKRMEQQLQREFPGDAWKSDPDLAERYTLRRRELRVRTQLNCIDEFAAKVHSAEVTASKARRSIAKWYNDNVDRAEHGAGGKQPFLMSFPHDKQHDNLSVFGDALAREAEELETVCFVSQGHETVVAILLGALQVHVPFRTVDGREPSGIHTNTIMHSVKGSTGKSFLHNLVMKHLIDGTFLASTRITPQFLTGSDAPPDEDGYVQTYHKMQFFMDEMPEGLLEYKEKSGQAAPSAIHAQSSLAEMIRTVQTRGLYQWLGPIIDTKGAQPSSWRQNGQINVRCECSIHCCTNRVLGQFGHAGLSRNIVRHASEFDEYDETNGNGDDPIRPDITEKIAAAVEASPVIAERRKRRFQRWNRNQFIASIDGQMVEGAVPGYDPIDTSCSDRLYQWMKRAAKRHELTGFSAGAQPGHLSRPVPGRGVVRDVPPRVRHRGRAVRQAALVVPGHALVPEAPRRHAGARRVRFWHHARLVREERPAADDEGHLRLGVTTCTSSTTTGSWLSLRRRPRRCSCRAGRRRRQHPSSSTSSTCTTRRCGRRATPSPLTTWSGTSSTRRRSRRRARRRRRSTWCGCWRRRWPATSRRNPGRRSLTEDSIVQALQQMRRSKVNVPLWAPVNGGGLVALRNTNYRNHLLQLHTKSIKLAAVHADIETERQRVQHMHANLMAALHDVIQHPNTRASRDLVYGACRPGLPHLFDVVSIHSQPQQQTTTTTALMLVNPSGGADQPLAEDIDDWFIRQFNAKIDVGPYVLRMYPSNHPVELMQQVFLFQVPYAIRPPYPTHDALFFPNEFRTRRKLLQRRVAKDAHQRQMLTLEAGTGESALLRRERELAESVFQRLVSQSRQVAELSTLTNGRAGLTPRLFELLQTTPAPRTLELWAVLWLKKWNAETEPIRHRLVELAYPKPRRRPKARHTDRSDAWPLTPAMQHPLTTLGVLSTAETAATEMEFMTQYHKFVKMLSDLVIDEDRAVITIDFDDYRVRNGVLQRDTAMDEFAEERHELLVEAEEGEEQQQQPEVGYLSEMTEAEEEAVNALSL